MTCPSRACPKTMGQARLRRHRHRARDRRASRAGAVGETAGAAARADGGPPVDKRPLGIGGNATGTPALGRSERTKRSRC